MGCGIEPQLTVVGLDSLQIHLPSQVLPIDLAHIGHEESIFLPRAASIGVDVANTALQGILDQRLPILCAITNSGVIDKRLSVEMDVCMFFGGSRGGRWCHNHAETAGAKICAWWSRRALGGLEDVRSEAGRAKPSGLFLVKRKNLLGLLMRQLRVG